MEDVKETQFCRTETREKSELQTESFVEFQGTPPSFSVSIALCIHVRKLPEATERATKKERIEKFIELSQGWE